MTPKLGKLTIHDGANVWPHEIKTARSLTALGHNVDFYPKSNQKYRRSADAYIDHELWEFKSPTSDKLDAIERNLKRGKKQSSKIVLDSRRMKHIPDLAIERELRAKSKINKTITHLKYINRHGKVIDIKPQP